MIDEITQDAGSRMLKSVESLKTDLTKIRTGRAHPSLLDQVMVDYYGTPTPIKQVANVVLKTQEHWRLRHGKNRWFRRLKRRL